MGRRHVGAAALATTMLAIAGCGSSAKPLTSAELKTKANAICKTVSTKLASSTKGGVSGQQGLARVATKIASFEQSALAELSKLVPPAALANDWKQFVGGAETLAENTAKLGEYAKDNNLKAGRSLIASSEAVQHQMQATAKRDGLTACEQVP